MIHGSRRRDGDRQAQISHNFLTNLVWKETSGRLTMLTEVIDAVIGTGTHRDSHEVEIADPAGKPIATLRIGNDNAWFG